MKEKEIKKSSILSRWKNQKQNSLHKNIAKAPQNVALPLSYGQQQLWFMQQLYPENPFYNYAEGYTLKGYLHAENLVKALRTVFSLHDVLFSSYHVLNNETVQKIEQFEIEVPFFDISNLQGQDLENRQDELISSITKKRIDLDRPPLFSVVLIKKREAEHLLLLTLHHILSDNWSMKIFLEQLANCYTDLCLNQPTSLVKSEIQYQDFAFWQKSQDLNQGQLDYWKNKLESSPSYLEIPTDFSRPLKPSYRGAMYTKVYSKSLSTAVLDLARKLNVTPYTLLLTVFKIFLFKYSGQNDITVGSPVSNRNQKALESLIGFFNDTVVLRNTISESMAFLEVLKSVRADVLSSFSNKDIPFEFLVKSLKPERQLNVNPFFQVMFVYHVVSETPSFGPDLEVHHAPIGVGAAKFDMTLYVYEDKGILSMMFEYATDIYTEETVAKFQDFYQHLLEEIVKNPDQQISAIPVTTAESVIEASDTFVKNKLWSTKKGIHSIIEQQAKDNREKHAVTFKGEYVTFGTLNDRAEKLAKIIFGHTAGRNEIVGLCLPRSIDMIVGLLAILKAGCAYLPLDPDYPEERLKFMLKDTSAKLVVTTDALSALFENVKVTSLLIDSLIEQNEEPNVHLPEVQNSNRAYVIYTSGSTGRPKGVPISHENIINSTWSRTEFYDENPSSFLLLSSISFDSSKAGIFWTLCTGGKLVISEERLEQDLDHLGMVISTNKVSHTLMLPTLYNIVLEHSKSTVLESLTTVIVAGEACSPLVAQNHFRILPHVKFYNEYGPTEATVWCIAHQMTKANLNNFIPIGKPIANAKIYLLNDRMNQVPSGAVGEIYVGGYGLAIEYLNRPDLTSKVFVDNPFSMKGEKLYKTGDLGKIGADGTIFFLGRADHQVKIRGHRIELDEIKNTVLEQSGITDAEVVVTEVNGAEQLVLYLRSQQEIDISLVKKALTTKLPKYMVPNRFVVLNEFPKLPNGKVDVKGLKELKAKEKNSTEITPPSSILSPVQQKLVNIWQDVLKMDTVTIHDNFFEIGGDSILSIQIITQARKLGLHFSPNELFEHQTIAELEVSLLKSKDSIPQETKSLVGPVPRSPIQLWYFDTHKNAPHFWNQGYEYRLTNNQNQEIIKSAAESIFQKHDALRTLFEERDGSWSAKVVDSVSQSPYEYYDLSKVEDAMRSEQMEKILIEIQASTKLDKGPLFRSVYFDSGVGKEAKIIILAHHLVVDMVSWRLILDEFASCLKNGSKGKALRTTSILEWGDYLSDLAKSENIVQEADFWKDQYVAAGSFPKDFQKPLPVTENNVGVLEYSLDPVITKDLTSKANESYSTKTDELVMAAVAITFTKWAGVDTISFAMERHGRETLGTDMDLSNTVGWFTAFFPIAFELSGSLDLEKDIIAVKEKMRNIPNGGIGYGVLRYLTKHLGTMDYPQFVFNFLGNRDGTEFEFLSGGVRHPESERNYLVEINSIIDNGKLKLYWSYSKEHYLPETMEVLMKNFDTNLKKIIFHCTGTNEGKFTPSDFPELGMDQNDLDGLLDSLDL